MSVRARVKQEQFRSAAAEAVVSVVVAADQFVQSAGVVCARHGITGDQYNVLRILRGAFPDGRARSDIEQRLMRRSPDVTRLLDRLVRAKLVTRTRGRDDGRQSIATITKTGLALLERLDPEIEDLMQSVTARLGPGQLRQLATLADALVK